MEEDIVQYLLHGSFGVNVGPNAKGEYFTFVGK